MVSLVVSFCCVHGFGKRKEIVNEKFEDQWFQQHQMHRCSSRTAVISDDGTPITRDCTGIWVDKGLNFAKVEGEMNSASTHAGPI